jgi:hypothetical protein
LQAGGQQPAASSRRGASALRELDSQDLGTEIATKPAVSSASWPGVRMIQYQLIIS